MIFVIETVQKLFNKLKELELIKVFSELENVITTENISDATGSLKNDKPDSFDTILNKMS